MTRRELGIDPALQQQTQARVPDPRVGEEDGVIAIAGRMRAALSAAPSAAPKRTRRKLLRKRRKIQKEEVAKEEKERMS